MRSHNDIAVFHLHCIYNLYRCIHRYILQEAGRAVPSNSSSVRRYTKKKSNNPRVLLVTDLIGGVFESLGDVE